MPITPDDRINPNLFEDECFLYKLEEGYRSSETLESFENDINEKINEKYVRGDIRIVTEQARYPLDSILSLMTSVKYKLDPEFQRRRRWDNVRKSSLIESFIMNIPIPPIFLYEKQYASFEVMDGQQRLSAICEFYEDKYALEGLQEWKELNGKKYSELPDKIKAGIDRRYISSIILLQETAKNEQDAQRLQQLVFDRINSGGIQLEPQESRNAVYAGPLNTLCNQNLAKNLTLKKLWFFADYADLQDSDPEILEGKSEEEQWQIVCERSESYKKMDDVELVLRFFAYRQLDQFPRSLPLRDILDRFLQKGNNFPEKVLIQYEVLFFSTINLVYKVLGDKAFQLYRKDARAKSQWKWTDKPLKVVYDPIMYAFSQNTDHSEQLILQKDDFLRSLGKLYQDNSSLFSGRKTTPTDTLRRMNLMFNHITGFLSK